MNAYKTDRIWLTPYKWLPASNVSSVREADIKGGRAILVEERNGQVHQTAIEWQEAKVNVTYIDNRPKPSAVITGIFEKQWKQTGPQTSVFVLAGKINHLISDGGKRKQLAVDFIRMKIKENRVSATRPPDVIHEKEIKSAAETLAVLLVGALRGMKYCHISF